MITTLPPATDRSESQLVQSRLTYANTFNTCVKDYSVDICPHCGGLSPPINSVGTGSIDEPPEIQALIIQLRESICVWLHRNQIYMSDLAEAAELHYGSLYHFLRKPILRGPAAKTYASLRDREMWLPAPWDGRTARLLNQVCQYFSV